MGITTRLLFEVLYLSLVYIVYRATSKVNRRRFCVSVLLFMDFLRERKLLGSSGQRRPGMEAKSSV